MEEINYLQRAKDTFKEIDTISYDPDEYDARDSATQHTRVAALVSIAQSLEKLAAVAEVWMKSAVTITTPVNSFQGIQPRKETPEEEAKFATGTPVIPLGENRA